MSRQLSSPIPTRLAALAAPAQPLPVSAPAKVSEHTRAWIGPSGSPTGENQGSRMHLGFVVGTEAVDEVTGLKDAIEGLAQSPWQDLADFDAPAGRNARAIYLERQAAAFE